jgi:periplasmic protein TonB
MRRVLAAKRSTISSPSRPNALPPAREASPPPAKPVVGMSLASTTVAGTFAAIVGNTLYGGTPNSQPTGADTATNFGSVAAERVVRTRPRVEKELPIPYPPVAGRAGVSGSVVMRVAIDALGHVSTVSVIRGVGLDLDGAAVDAIRHFRFVPATENGFPVASEITYTYRFALE